MADGKIIIEIEARDTGLTAALEQARQKAQQAATAMSRQASAAQSAGGAISNMAGQLGRLNIAGTLTGPMGQAATAARQMQGGISGAMSGVQSAAGRTAASLSGLQTAMNQTARAAGTMASGVQQQSSAVQSAIARLVTAAVNQAKNAAVQFRQAGAQYAGNLAAGMNQGRAGVQSGARGLVTSALTPWSAAKAQFRQAGLASAQSAAAGISGGTGAMGQTAQRAMNIGGWYGLGYNISAGVASGVYGGSYLITAAARTAAQNALAAAKRSLGVNSPSRVFRDQVGKMIPAGMAEGISMATPMAQKAVTLSAQTLRDTGRAALDPSGGAVMGSMGAMERPGAQTTAQFTGNVVLEAPLYLDGREIARASAKYTGRQMAYLEGL